MSYSKCAMPSLSCLLSFYTIPISLFFNSKNFLFSSLPSFLCINAYIKSSGFIGDKVPRPLKKLPFYQTMVMLDYVCVQSFMITHTQCFMLIVVYKVICSHCLRLVAIGYD